jgi:hypothetical protein
VGISVLEEFLNYFPAFFPANSNSNNKCSANNNSIALCKAVNPGGLVYNLGVNVSPYLKQKIEGSNTRQVLNSYLFVHCIALLFFGVLLYD